MEATATNRELCYTENASCLRRRTHNFTRTAEDVTANMAFNFECVCRRWEDTLDNLSTYNDPDDNPRINTEMALHLLLRGGK
jgi:hypothetical protein